MARRTTYDKRRDDLAVLFYETVGDELYGRPRTNDIAARAVLADALEERGMIDLGERLRRFPADAPFSGSLLRAKVERAIFGPQSLAAARGSTRKPLAEVLLAYIPAPERQRPRLDVMRLRIYGRDRIVVDGSGERAFLFHTSYDGRYLVRDARSEEEAFEVARERWPHVFGADEDDEHSDAFYDFSVYRVGDVRRARVINEPGQSFRGRAYVPAYGVVEYR